MFRIKHFFKVQGFCSKLLYVNAPSYLLPRTCLTFLKSWSENSMVDTQDMNYFLNDDDKALRFQATTHARGIQDNYGLPSTSETSSCTPIAPAASTTAAGKIVKYERRVAAVQKEIATQLLKVELAGATEVNVAELKRLQNKRHTLKQALKDARQKLAGHHHQADEKVEIIKQHPKCQLKQLSYYPHDL